MTDQSQANNQQQGDDLSQRLQQSFFGDTPITQPEKQEDKTPDASAQNNVGNEGDKSAVEGGGKEVVEDKPLYTSDWLKNEFGVDDAAVLKAEREELKKLKEAPAPTAAEIKFENEQSKLIHELLRDGKTKEVREFLDMQERLSEYSTVEVGKGNAADIIKLGMKLKNPKLSEAEIEFQYKEDYVPPKEPVQRANETDEEYEERKNEWQSVVERVEMKRSIAAKMVQPELEAAKSKLVLPELSGNKNQSDQPAVTQEELDAWMKSKDSVTKESEKYISEFGGFNVSVKDKDVDYTVNYAPSSEEKTMVSSLIKKFSESGFNANALFVDRWVAEDGKTINVNKMSEDLLYLFSRENTINKIASDSANKRMEAYLKDKKNLNLSGNGGGTIPLEQKSQSQKLQEQFWS